MTEAESYGSSNPQIGEDMYVVDKILKKRIILKNGRSEVLYFVRWEGYPDLDDHTWEPLENLSSCPMLIQEFEQRLKKKQKKDKEQEEAKQIAQQAKREIVKQKQITNQKARENPSLKGSVNEPIELDDRPHKVLKKHSSKEQLQHRLGLAKHQSHQKIDSVKSISVEEKKDKSGNLANQGSLDPRKAKDSAKVVQKQAEKRQVVDYGRVLSHDYREGSLWYQVERLSHDKKVLRVQKVTAQSSASLCLKSTHAYLQNLLIMLQKRAQAVNSSY